MSTGHSLRRRPIVSVFAGSKTDATAKLDLAATYGLVGSAVNINGQGDKVMFLRELANTENAVVRYYLAHDGAAPASATGMYQLVGTNGAEIETVVTQNLRKLFPLQSVAGKYILLNAKGASGTAADLSAFMSGNHFYDNKAGGDARILGKSQAIIATATNLTGSYADVGVAVDIRGLGDLTLFVDNTGDQTGDIQVYTTFGATAPTATTNMYPLAVAAGTVSTFTTLTVEKAAHPLTGISGDFLMIQGKTTGSGTATVTVYLFGNPAGI